MWQFLERAFLILLLLALCGVTFFFDADVHSYISKDSQLVIIGVMGLLIGGSLTLVISELEAYSKPLTDRFIKYKK